MLKKSLLICTKLFSNIITVLIKFFLLFFYLFVNLFTYFLRNEDDSDDVLWSDEEEYEDEDEDEEEEEEEISEVGHSHVINNHLVADIVNNGQGLMFMSEYKHGTEHEHSSSSCGSSFEDAVGNFDGEIFYVEDDCSSSDSELDEKPHDFNDYGVSSATIYPSAIELKEHSQKIMNTEDVKVTNLSRDEKFLIFDLPKSKGNKSLQVVEIEKYERFEDTNTVGSTSKSSSEWRSSIPDSGTEDPFSSSSRSCPKWESYTVYHKYDEEMLFLDKISAQKLHETESMRSIKVEPRSISQRIVHKLGQKQNSWDQIYNKTYDELEAAYVGQICLAWEALNWNYATFLRKRVCDPSCPAYVAQQFQQFQVLLQRYIENEPYERGRRPHIYARIRCSAPNLLQVPEYHDYEGEDMEEALSARVTSASFLSILQDSIRTFMKFLKADRKTHCEVVTGLFKRRQKRSVDPAVLHVVKNHCKKKKMKLKEVERKSSILFRKKKIEREEEMEILMASIDIEVVSRVLRMTLLTQQQLKWCEDKMDKVRVFERKLQRDSSPLFFPGYPPTKSTLVVDSP
ncbi:uncharacterized protein LOC141600435 [Silene latifolia]|uniref:uncharacterized protein LOC141600435 n=1 Tax=Silene latifolia TaxID=37657 RepID=UPI003D776107